MITWLVIGAAWVLILIALALTIAGLREPVHLGRLTIAMRLHQAAFVLAVLALIGSLS